MAHRTTTSEILRNLKKPNQGAQLDKRHRQLLEEIVRRFNNLSSDFLEHQLGNLDAAKLAELHALYKRAYYRRDRINGLKGPHKHYLDLSQLFFSIQDAFSHFIDVSPEYRQSLDASQEYAFYLGFTQANKLAHLTLARTSFNDVESLVRLTRWMERTLAILYTTLFLKKE